MDRAAHRPCEIEVQETVVERRLAVLPITKAAVPGIVAPLFRSTPYSMVNHSEHNSDWHRPLASETLYISEP